MYKFNIQYIATVLIFVLILIGSNVYSQSSADKMTTGSKKAIKSYKKAQEAHKLMDLDKVIVCLRESIKHDSGFIEAHLYLGEIAKDKKDYDQAIISYRKAVAIDPGFFPLAFLSLANLEFMSGKYLEASGHFSDYISYGRYSEERGRQVARKIENCEFAIIAVANPLDFNPENLGSNVNTINDEYVNAITTDGFRLFFTKKFPGDQVYPNGRPVFTEDFYFSKRDKGQGWQAAVSLGPPINTRGNEGAMNISPDGNSIFFAACHREDGLGSCDLYYSVKMGYQWARPVHLGNKINSKRWDSQPSLSSDGSTLFFVSTRASGKGKSDIWYSVKDDEGVWGIPVNLGDSINTSGTEMSPVIHPDGTTLYFSSNGHLGMGGLDLYMSRKKTDGTWSAPVNLGYPLNTSADEQGLIVEADGRFAYFSSDKLGGEGKYDIYRFELPEFAKPVPVTYMKGVVYDNQTEKRLLADFELIDLNTGEVVVRAESDAVNGEFLVSIPANRSYALSVESRGYLFYSENIDIKGIYDAIEPMVQNIPLQSLSSGSHVVLKNIFFETDSYELRPESKVELNRLVKILEDNPAMIVEIGGHTDDIGGYEYNMELSGKRARAVVDYLVSGEINPTRVTHKGYGYSIPVDSNETAEGRSKNRRTEFMVVKF